MTKLWLLLVLGGAAAGGQDTRVVKEPVIPVACAKLPARLASVGGKVAEADEEELDTVRIQQALDGCKAGQAVELVMGAGGNAAAGFSASPRNDNKKAKANARASAQRATTITAGSADAFLTGPLEMRSGVTLLIDKGVTLYGSRDPAMYEISVPGSTEAKCATSVPRPGTFGQEAGQAQAQAVQRKGGCRPLISATNVTDAAVMGDGVIDGRGYAQLKGRDFSWWEMARKAEPKNDIYYTTRLIVASHADGLVLYRITLHNSPNFHVTVNATDGFTAWGVHLLTPLDSKLDARNTDGIDPGTSTNVTVTHSWIDNGDDNIAIKSGTTHMSVIDNHFYTGHGMSIGSETMGQAYVLVDGLTLDHTSSGIRIKSNVTRGGSVHDLTYRNICMRGVANPIAISPYYTNQTTEGFVDPGYAGTKIPDYKRIVLENVYSETPGDVLIAGLNEEHRTQITLGGVHIDGIQSKQMHLAFDDVHIRSCSAFHNGAFTNLPLEHVPGTVRVIPSGEAGCGVYTTKPVDPCAGKFLPMR